MKEKGKKNREKFKKQWKFCHFVSQDEEFALDVYQHIQPGRSGAVPDPLRAAATQSEGGG